MKPVMSMMTLLLCAAAAHAQPRPVDEDRVGRTLHGLTRGVEGDDLEQVLLALARVKWHLDAGAASVKYAANAPCPMTSPLLLGATRVLVRVGDGLETTVEDEPTAARHVRIEREAPARVTAKWGGAERSLVLEETVEATVVGGKLGRVRGIRAEGDARTSALTAGFVGALNGDGAAVDTATVDAPLGERLGERDLPTFGQRRPRLVARFERTTFAGRRNQGKEGTITINGNAYRFRTGGYGDGHLPAGEYTATPHLWSRRDAGFSVGTVGWSVALTDKHDPRVGRVRSLLRIHPDGNGPGTEGCLGIVGDAATQARCRDDLKAELERGAGRFTLVVTE